MTTSTSVPHIGFSDGRQIPALGLGTYKLQGEECVRVVREAIESGYRHFDTATLYHNEEALGKGLREAIAAGDVAREDLFVTSKVWHDHQGADRLPLALEQTLGQLGLDYVDLYLIHWPWPQGGKFVETFEEMARQQDQGKITSLGVANFYEDTLETLIDRTGIVPALNQVELHLGFTQPGLRDFHDKHGIVTSAWSPIARGKILDNPAVEKISQEIGATAGQVALSYLLHKDIVVIPKTARRERLEENFASAFVQLSAGHIQKLDDLEGANGMGRMWQDPREFPGRE